MPILPTERDPRLITVRRGGTLTDEDHRLLAEWAALCATHVLPLFEQRRPNDARPRDAIEIGRAWLRGEVRMRDAHRAAFPANAAGRDQPEPAKFAALAAGPAVAVAHVAAHALGAAAYATRRTATNTWPVGADNAHYVGLKAARRRILMRRGNGRRASAPPDPPLDADHVSEYRRDNGCTPAEGVSC